MMLFVRTQTPMGPRTTVHGGMAPEDARALALEASTRESAAGAVIEDGRLLNMAEYMRANRGKVRRPLGLANVPMTEPLRQVLSAVLVKLERPRRAANGG